MGNIIRFEVSIPTDNGFVGHSCKSPECGKYFKVHQDDRAEEMLCPYCGQNFPQSDLFTEEQSRHIRKSAEAEALYDAEKEMQKMFKGAFGGSSGRRSGFVYKPSRISKKSVSPNYTERIVDSQLECSECNCRFQVYGVFGHCPSCGESNMKVYDTNWAKIKKDVDGSDNPHRTLRHAYSDLVSTFECFCDDKAKRVNAKPPSFQRLFDARKFFNKHCNVNILEGLDDGELLALRRVFEKRNVNTHAGGVLGDRYVQMIPEDSSLLGQQVTMSMDELKTAAVGIRKALLKLVGAIERNG